MAILDQVNSMKQQGASDQEVISSLQQDGYNPKEIKDAIDKSNIKGAVKDEQPPNQQGQNMDQGQNYQQGFGQQPAGQGGGQQNYNPQPQQGQQQFGGGQQQGFGGQQNQQAQSFNSGGQQPMQQQNYGGQQDYDYGDYGGGYEYDSGYDYEGGYDYSGGYDYGGGYGGSDTETIMDVAEQVVEEKTKEIQKQMRDFQEFSTITQSKLKNFEERIKKMENLIDNLQVKILEKVSSYGKDIKSVKNEMGMMQDSFKKMAPELQKRGQQQASNKSSGNQEQEEQRNY